MGEADPVAGPPTQLALLTRTAAPAAAAPTTTAADPAAVTATARTEEARRG
ncbi:hypothetical protein [Arsenicicoccus dermatophilus]|uniref:hypothetical protein n=1 Tax=Arsenicicoccus dermatophilus TaxID=1076331 RepID=UPI0030C66CA0